MEVYVYWGWTDEEAIAVLHGLGLSFSEEDLILGDMRDVQRQLEESATAGALELMKCDQGHDYTIMLVQKMILNTELGEPGISSWNMEGRDPPPDIYALPARLILTCETLGSTGFPAH